MTGINKIFVNGSFDVLHTGHIDLLNYAKSKGDYLLVAIDSDRRIAEKKGLDRPFNKVKDFVSIR
jgi:cytidyltransferase-like protein